MQLTDEILKTSACYGWAIRPVSEVGGIEFYNDSTRPKKCLWSSGRVDGSLYFQCRNYVPGQSTVLEPYENRRSYPYTEDGLITALRTEGWLVYEG